jgi:histidyl-tRNA synthetase
VEVIFLLATLFRRLDVSDITAHINSLGCPDCRPKFKKALTNMLTSVSDKLCSDCKRRKDRNPLRVLDCKVPGCREVMANAPSILDYLCTDCATHFDFVTQELERLKVPFSVDKRLVRGLDYYTRTTFEMQTGALGAQSAVAGGGRYDGLIEALGGPSQPAIGFAVGFDRLAEIVALSNQDYAVRPHLYIAALGEAAKTKAFKWRFELGLAGIVTEMEMGQRSLKSQMKQADRSGAAYVLIVGENEIKQNEAPLRNMQTKAQEAISLADVVATLKKKFK